MEIYTQLAILWLFGIGLEAAAIVWVVRNIRKNRDSNAYQLAARFGVKAALAVGVAGLIHWVIWGNEPLWPFSMISIPIFYMAPTFIISFVAVLAWQKKAN